MGESIANSEVQSIQYSTVRQRASRMSQGIRSSAMRINLSRVLSGYHRSRCRRRCRRAQSPIVTLIGVAVIGVAVMTFTACGGGGSFGGAIHSFFNAHPFGSARFTAGAQPVAVAIDRSRNVWAANQGSNSVTELKFSGGRATFDNSNTPGANFNLPDAIAIDAEGDVWVVNGGGSVTELTSAGVLIGNFAPFGAGFSSPAGIAIDASGNVWITNTGGNSVTELNSSGALARNVNNTNTPAANFAGPAGIAIDGPGNVWVGNFSGNSLTKLNSAGAPLENFNNTNTSGAHFSGCEGHHRHRRRRLDR
jgi:streptogramin lyase